MGQNATIPIDPKYISEVKEIEINNRKLTQTIVRPPSAENSLAFVIDGVFTERECQDWIKLTEDKGYEPALVNIGGGKQKLMTDVRNNSRCIIDSNEMANEIYERIQPLLPQTWKDDQVKIVSLNERLRFLRYDPGEKFEPHLDGSYVRPDGNERSYVTLQLYLNEGFEGGATTFLGANELEKLPIIPKIGRVLIFEHRILHEGSELVKGRKYAVRTDVMYDTSSF